MSGLDGNAIAGMLFDVFSGDMTASRAKCAVCGGTGPMAETWVSLRGPGIVVRCRNCDNVLMVIVERRDIASVDLMGMAWLEPPASTIA
jgi:hypothetical protein